MEHNELRNDLVEELTSYYSRIGVNPYDFHCSHRYSCPGDNLVRGMECYIGLKYGEKKKILISSLDNGNGGSSDIKERTENVKRTHDDTPHIRGTMKCVMQLLDLESPDEAVDYMAMTNACKCCNLKSPNHLSYKYYENCKDYKIEEYHILKPDVILFQGKRDLSLRGCENFLKPTAIEYLYIYDDGVINCYGVVCIHPSARGKHANRRKKFYERIFPEIAKYIREQWDNELL